MLPAAEERTPALTSGEEIFSLAAGVALAALETHQGLHAAQGKKPHQGIFSKNHALRAGKSYTWDFENRLTQAVVPGANGGTTTFKYDPFGRRIQKSGPLGTTNYLYDGDGDNVIEAVDNSGNLLTRLTDTQNVDEPLSGLFSGTIGYYEQDALGSITSLSNSAGALSNTYTYDSFGNRIASTGTLTNPFQFTARDFDSETGIYYYRARYYDQSTGRFISEDPIRFRGGINFYRYVQNNPVLRSDPSGMCPTSNRCTCTGSGGSPVAFVCIYSCNCGGESQPDPAFFPMYALRRDCGWREKKCPMVVEGYANPRMYGSLVESIKVDKCYNNRPQ